MAGMNGLDLSGNTLKPTDDKNDGAIRAHRIPGKANWNVAPWPEFAVAQSRPRCPSTIERLMDRPMPNPPGFVV